MGHGCIFCIFYHFPKLNQKDYSGIIIEHRYAKVQLCIPCSNTQEEHPSHHRYANQLHVVTKV
jgi:hypothetical protein